jgi:hypothetical protein
LREETVVASYFRIQQDLIQLINSALDQDLSFEQAYALKENQLKSVLSKIPKTGMDDLWAIGMEFNRWLDDEDIRRRDLQYHKVLSEPLRRWCEAHVHKNSSD